MPRPRHARASCRGASLATALLGGVLLGLALDSTVPAHALATGATAAAAGVAAARMATEDSFDARLAAAMVSTVSALLALVVMTAGVPGVRGSGGDLTVPGVTLVACGVAVPLLLARSRRSGPRPDRQPRPYAP